MSSENSCCSDDFTRESLRRSRRITRHNIQKTKMAAEKPSATESEHLLRMRSNKKSPVGTEQKAGDKSFKRDIRVFSGEPLTEQELHQLMVKFKKDRHFRYNPTNCLSPQPVASSTNDSRPVAMKRKRIDSTAGTATSQRANGIEKIEKKRILHNTFVSEAITSSNPLPNATGSTMQISANKNSYVPMSRSEYCKSWSGPIICRNLLSLGSFREGNGINVSWDKDPFPAVDSFNQVATTVNSYKQIFKNTNMGASCKSFERGHMDNRNAADNCSFYSNHDKPQTGANDHLTNLQIRRSNHENTDNAYVNCTKLRAIPSYTNIRANFIENGNAAGSSFGKQMTSGNPTIVMPTENPYDPTNIWNVTSTSVANTFGADNTSMQNLIGQQNTMNYLTSDFGYNNENKNSNDLQHHSYGFGNDGNSGIGCNNNYNSHYLMSWKGLQGYPNSYATANDLYVNDATNCSIPPTLPSIFNESGHFVNQASYCLQNNVPNKGSFLNTGYETGLSVIGNNFASPVAPPTTTMTDESAIEPGINTNDKANVYINDFLDSQNRTFCPTVSSVGSYDDDIDYDNCLVIDENPPSTATTPNRESNLDLFGNMKAEATPMYDATANYSPDTHNCKFTNLSSQLYNFETKAEFTATSPECINIQNSTRT